MADSWLEVGRVRSASAPAREVRVVVKADYEYVFADMAWIRFRRGSDDRLRCKVLRVRLDGDTAIVALSPGVSRDVVGKLRGARVILTPDELPPEPGRKIRLADLIGLRVVMPDGKEMGAVVEAFKGPANDAIAVERPDGGQSILPVIDLVIQSVDLEQGEIHVGDIAPYVVEY